MRLKTIKLSGFKSFVDPTTFHLPSNLIGVVGPNGCGKSNIIDAVRWVMGETSAKLLRGESMSDVIFNGSNARKPVGAATVSLIFDNSDGAVQGEYAAYSEIAVKRQVSRDGQSAYFLNNARCRRRDITDIFLGTGLGPRSYSIIEQGMISRIVEAKPDDMRHYLEEAAGISKYKERRRETENRIRHTRENLERLDDLRAEVAKQLNHLGRQAKQAERYKALKSQERQTDAELIALQWRELQQGLEARARQLARLETESEAELARLRAVEADIETARAQQAAVSETVSKVQGELYQVGGDIARIEQDISHRKELQARQRREREEAERSQQELEEHLALDRVQLQDYEGAIAKLTPALASASALEQSTGSEAAEAEASMQQWQQNWDAFHAKNSELSQTAEVTRTKIEHLDGQLQQAADKLAELTQEQSVAEVMAAEEEVEQLEQTLNDQQQNSDASERQLDELRSQWEAQQKANGDVSDKLDALRDNYQQNHGLLSSLEALQQAALGDDDGAAAKWLQQQGLKDADRLARALSVEPGWETAVETVLGDVLEAVLVKQDPHSRAEALGELPGGRVSLLAGARGGAVAAAADSLISKVKGPDAIAALLAGVRVAEDIAAAQDLVAELGAGQSVITRQGIWLGPGWVRVVRGEDGGGVITREQEIADLRQELKQLSERGEAAKEELTQGRQRAADLARQREQLQTELNMSHRRLAELSGQLQNRRARIEHLRSRHQRIIDESDVLKKRMAEDEQALRQARAQLQQRVDEMGAQETERERLQQERVRLKSVRDEVQAKAKAAQQQAHELALSLESRRAALSSMQQGLDRIKGQIAQLVDRRQELNAQIEEVVEPLETEQGKLKKLLDQRLQVDQRLTQARRDMDRVNLRLRELEQKRHQYDQLVQEQRSALETERLEQQSFKVKSESFEEQLTARSLEVRVLLEGLDEQASVAAWQQQLASLEQKIRRLEPVNLAAIDEQKELQERKQYLDTQNDDLLKALETLEQAIGKIDRKTRSRFKETFDQVNQGVRTLFPRLFGGGQAHLELVGEDLLSAGVAIMARPPGKRISSIHLLSGGEKALTAVAFVFAIFQLNPAPFCLLDEVDAPLDDANVGRFSEMVREMSEQVQFLFVTHNKVTMEVANQLCGVTMREAGVSRLVSVDIAEAAEMVEA